MKIETLEELADLMKLMKEQGAKRVRFGPLEVEMEESGTTFGDPIGFSPPAPEPIGEDPPRRRPPEARAGRSLPAVYDDPDLYPHGVVPGSEDDDQ